MALVVGFMSLLDVTIVNVAIPSIRAGLDTSTGDRAVGGVGLRARVRADPGRRRPARRRLRPAPADGDRPGRLRACPAPRSGFAPTAELVVVARLLQGAAAGLLTPQNSGLIQQLFRGPERGRAFGLFGLTVSVSSAPGRCIGGLIIALAGERGRLALAVPGQRPDRPGRAGASSPASSRRRRTDEAATRGSTSSARCCSGRPCCACSIPLVSLEAGARCRWCCSLAVAPVVSGRFVRWEQRIGRARPAAAARRGLLRAGCRATATGWRSARSTSPGSPGVFLVLSVHLQDGARTSRRCTPALLLTPFAVGSAVTAPLAGRLVSADRLAGSRWSRWP